MLASQWEEEEKTELAGPGQTNTVITISDYFSIESKLIHPMIIMKLLEVQKVKLLLLAPNLIKNMIIWGWMQVPSAKIQSFIFNQQMI